MLAKILREKPFVNNEDNHPKGFCLSNLNSNLIYIPIPKNSSNWISEAFIRGGWYQDNCLKNKFLENKKVLIILRDPLDRWISGFSEYVTRKVTRGPRRGTIQLNFKVMQNPKIYENFIYDEHTQLQSFYVDFVDLNKAEFFYMDSGYTDKITTFLSKIFTEHVEFESIRKNANEEKETRRYVKSILQIVLKNNPDIVCRIKDFYKDDYNLLNELTTTHKLKRNEYI
jgi:hypothetical protein